jgi:hypothetical protein
MLADDAIEKIRLRVESAFNPLRCVAEIWDYKAKLRFKIFDTKGQGIVELTNVTLDGMSSAGNLEDLIQGVRREITAKGFALT